MYKFFAVFDIRCQEIDYLVKTKTIDRVDHYIDNLYKLDLEKSCQWAFALNSQKPKMQFLHKKIDDQYPSLQWFGFSIDGISDIRRCFQDFVQKERSKSNFIALQNKLISHNLIDMANFDTKYFKTINMVYNLR